MSLRDVEVVTLYLLPALNERLKPKLLNEMRAGARVVSHAFDMGDWPHEEFREIADKRVYRWTIPAIAGGEWQLLRDDGSVGRLSIDQRYSRLSGRLDGAALGGAQLDGSALSFAVDGKAYRGVVGDRAILGEGWRAERID